MYYTKHDGLELDYTLAREYFTMASENGHPNAQSNLGNIFTKGLGVDVNFDSALACYQASASNRFPLGYYNLGTAYLFGRGVEKDPVRAYVLFRVAKMLGYSEADQNIGVLEKQLTIKDIEIAEAKISDYRDNDFRSGEW